METLYVVFSADNRLTSTQAAGTISHKAASADTRPAAARGAAFTHVSFVLITGGSKTATELSVVDPEGAIEQKRKFTREERNYAFVRVDYKEADRDVCALVRFFFQKQVGQPYAWLASYLNFIPLISNWLPCGLTLSDLDDWERALRPTSVKMAQHDDIDDDEEEEEETSESSGLLHSTPTCSDLLLSKDPWDPPVVGTLPVIVKPWTCAEFVIAGLFFSGALRIADLQKHPCLYSPDQLYALLVQTKHFALSARPF